MISLQYTLSYLYKTRGISYNNNILKAVNDKNVYSEHLNSPAAAADNLQHGIR